MRLKNKIVDSTFLLFLLAFLAYVLWEQWVTFLFLVFLSFALVIISWFYIARIWRGRSRLRIAAYLVIFLVVSNGVIGILPETIMWKNSGLAFDSLLGWRPKPNLINEEFRAKHGNRYLVTTNQFGHRTKYEPNTETRFSFVIQGDSNAFGFGLNYADTICPIVESRVGHSCYNAGMLGYDINQYYFQYDEIKPLIGKYRVILLNEGNDITAGALATPYFFPRPYLYFQDDRAIRSGSLELRYKYQGYSYRFISPLQSYDDCLQPYGRRMGWVDKYPEWVLAAPLLRLAIHRFHGNIGRWLPVKYCKNVSSLTPYYPTWLSKPLSYWPKPYREYISMSRNIIRLMAQQGSETLIFLLMPIKREVLNNDCNVDRINEIKKLFFSIAEEFENLMIVDTKPYFCAENERSNLYQSDNHLSAKGIGMAVYALIDHLNRMEVSRENGI